MTQEADTRFDVILLDSPSVEMLMEKLNLSRQQAERLASKRLARRNIPLEEAKQVCAKLRALGLTCNYRPTLFSGAKLELVPLDERPAEEKFVCPACGHEQAVGDGTFHQCEKCGVVKEKWEKVQAEKLERERIKRALLRRHEEERRRCEEEAAWEEERRRREALEEEIRKQLGLPKFMHSRTALFSSASLILLGGVLAGAVGMMVYNNSGSEQPPPPPR
ncbi:hypothetical protein MIT9_P2488 [Methylomarinovum caldicuralii]|uniref:Uncharacterized protein n=1 Tax=Methylomarinovum caldicuralii TaxID=438856 RepID=A0AAU9CY02_9GAMM|nr:hypothetical protein [Methylomarinovum caldicuralii]BCX82897.1 hypothetical protein MIT9_P2488 [Methylomarinovum caldicuralii]